MHQASTTKTPPTKGIWTRFLVLVPLIVALVIGSWAYIKSTCATFEAWTPPSIERFSFDAYDLEDVTYSTPGIVEAVAVDHFPTGAARVTFNAVADGETAVTFGGKDIETVWNMSVRDGAIIEDGVNFSGWEAIHISICIVLGVTVALFASVLVRLKRRAWFGYEMVASGGGLIFCLFQLALFIYLFARRSLLTFADMAYQLSAMADYFVIATLAPMGVLALLVSISNISLIRHEGKRPANLLGIAISVAWLAAIWLWFRWWTIGEGMAWSYETLSIVSCLIAVAIAFGECLLLSTIICAWVASRHMPERPADYLVVLGCGIRADGMPSPLLAGRVDKARAFDAACVEAGQAPATFVPSGGQGPDEVMSEAQSMRDYLVAKGVAPERIVLEDRSTTTRENMAFSREVIEQHAGRDANELSVAFSTTNYHVFRGYVCAHQAGMEVEGMGSKTRAYFWPNAFLREFAGLLVTQWRGILQTYLIIAIVYALAEYILLLS